MMKERWNAIYPYSKEDKTRAAVKACLVMQEMVKELPGSYLRDFGLECLRLRVRSRRDEWVPDEKRIKYYDDLLEEKLEGFGVIGDESDPERETELEERSVYVRGNSPDKEELEEDISTLSWAIIDDNAMDRLPYYV